MITDTFLQHYLFLQQENKRLTARIEEMKEILKDNGSCMTASFVVSVMDQERTMLKPMEAVCAAFTKELVKEYNLIQTVKFKTVQVSKINA